MKQFVVFEAKRFKHIVWNLAPWTRDVILCTFNFLLLTRPATLLKKRLWHRCFPANFGKILRTFFFFYRTPPMAASVHSNSLFYVSISSLAFLLTLSKCHSVFFTVLQPWSYYTSVLSQAFNYILDFLVRKIPKATFLMTSK